MKITSMGIDLAKAVLQVHGVDAHGNVELRKQLKRKDVLSFFANLEPCLIGMNRYLRYSFHLPLVTGLGRSGLELDVGTANVEVRRWLREVANARVHGTTGKIPAVELGSEREALLPLPPPWRGVIAPAQPRAEPVRSATPTRPLPAFPEQWTPQQHPLAVYAALVEVP